MADEPKLTQTFADKVAETQVAAFPASRMAGFSQPQFTTLPPQVLMPQTRREKVAIVGTAPSSRMLAPLGDPAWDIWVCSPGNMNVFPRIDAWFEIHGNLLWPEYAATYGQNYIDWLSKQPFPVYLQDEIYHKKYFAHGLRFPARELVEKFGEYWFNSSFAWMTAFAIYKGHYKEIGLYGVDMASKDEYIQQRQGFNRWFEIARELNITITVPKESDLAQRPLLYGYSEVTPHGRKLHARGSELAGRSDALNQEIQKTMAQLENLKSNKNYLDGAREDIDYGKTIWGGLQSPWGDDIPLEAALKRVQDAGYLVSEMQSGDRLQSEVGQS